MKYIQLIIKSFFLLSIAFSVSAAAPVTLREIAIPQDANIYVKRNQNTPLISSHTQKEAAKFYLSQWFAPWDKPWLAKSDVINSLKIESSKELNYYKTTPFWGENLRLRSSTWLKNLINNAQWDNFPNKIASGITILPTALRTLPTEKPFFNDPSLAGEGFPFDNAQLTLIPAGTPIQILHQTRNHEYYYIRSAISTGWALAKHVAFTDSAFINTWKNSPFLVMTHDDIPILDISNQLHRFNASIGDLFPLKATEKDQHKIYIPIIDEKQQAHLLTASLSSAKAAPFPVKMTPKVAASLINRFLNQAYGWGGYLNNRDCSATMRDYFSVFGIWLPRHSTDQLTAENTLFLKKYSFRKREDILKAKGKPFLTLLGHPGHVMLYLGVYKNEPIVFHNKWGLRTFSKDNEEERALIGYAAITPIHLGEKHARTDSLISITEMMRTPV